MAMGNLFMTTSQALGNAAHNATNAQLLASTTAQAAMTAGLSSLYALNTAATGEAADQING